ncbi:hypothetical protein AMAG_14777 [Allomyces macrogynus ATCC 38327]|uniref:Uncharacterized protein n=1 Tax=Allomyces macrogynus (strain ATCC 38327) TaxID=578462 RepID=A0A0L0T5E5_ALLM3|nr:hypothetical protein AMAG_14777 [Allomyces macrogynus ATCC 38327]|eukprot:KNE69931.1 hypothetical protein AMAG_14777 [Allomyces macrogynus ATCC 38327]
MVWNGKKGLRHFCFSGHKRDVTAVHFAPRAETNLLASSSLDKTVKLWTPSVKGDAVTVTAHTAAVRTVRFSPDTQHFLTCSDDKTIKLWSTSRTKYLTTLSAHTNWVRTATFHPTNPSILASGSDDQSIRSWDLRTLSQSPTHIVQHVGSYVLRVVMHATRPALAASTAAGAIHVYDTRMWRLVQHYPAAHGVVRASNVAPLATAARGAAAADGVHDVALDETGSVMVSAGGDGLVKCWDLSEGRLAYAVHGHDADGGGVATAVAVSADGTEWASGGADTQVLVWRWPGGGGEVGEDAVERGGIARWGGDADNTDRARRPSARRVPVDADDRADTGSASYLTTLSAHTNWVRTATFHPTNPSILASGSDDQSIRSWDLRTLSQSPTHIVQHVGSYVLRVVMHATRPALAASTAAGAIHVYDTRMWRLVQHYPAAHGVVRASNVAPLATAARGAAAADGVHDVALDETGSVMVSAGGDGLVKCWDLSEGRLAYAVHGHDADGGGVATAVAVSADGTEWASGGADTQVLVWRWPGGGGEVGEDAVERGGIARWGGDADNTDRARRPSARRVPVDADDRADTGSASTTVPPDLAATLATVVAQLDVLTATMAQLDRRLTMCEDRVNRDKMPEPGRPAANGNAPEPAAAMASGAAAVTGPKLAPGPVGGPRAAASETLSARTSGGT